MKLEILKTEEEFKKIKDNYYVATYSVESSINLRDAAWNIAIGQSIGNPSARSEFETQELYDNHSCLVLDYGMGFQYQSNKKFWDLDKGIIDIAFPLANINLETDGLTQVLVQTMGGQCDIDSITKCRLIDLSFPDKARRQLFKGPAIGLSGIKKYCGVPEDKPLLGGITKPKIGLSPDKHLDLVKKLVDGGCNFIKEDEILSDPTHCRIKERVEKVMNYIESSGNKVFYCVSIHSDPLYLLKRVQEVYTYGGNGIHVNFHCGLGVYKSIRDQGYNLLLHFQKSGDQILTHRKNAYGIDQRLLFRLMAASGCDTAHIGMIGGYHNSNEAQTLETIKNLNDLNAVPALSCGMNPGLVDHLMKKIGHGNWMANVGGALFSHPMGTLAGVKAMRQAIDGEQGKEFYEAIRKWGYQK
jgi:ribulose 1,5-bisphosphate carboxylase large subunit-like protein